MRFEEPQALVLLPAVAAVALLCWFTFRWKDRTLALFAHGETLPLLLTAVSRRRQQLKAVLVVLALAVLVVGLAKPYWGAAARAPSLRQADILLVMDVSLSMAAADVRPSRLEQAKAQAVALIDRLEGDRIGLVVFAGAPSLRFPLTYDYGAARSLVRAVAPDSAPSPGSALADGVLSAVRALRQSDAPVRAVFLLSDGEDLGSEIPLAVREATTEGVVVSTLGVGTPQGGTILVRGPGGTLAPKRDRSGQIVQTRLDAAALQSLAEQTGGRYALATDNGRELVTLYQRVQQQLSSRAPAAEDKPEDLGFWFVLAGLLLLMVEMLLPERRAARGLRAAAAIPLAAMLFAASCTGEAGPVFRLNEDGGKLFKEGNFAAALDRFRQAQVQRPDLPPLTFNVGGALYKTQEYDRALQETQRVLDNDDAGLRARAYFNMGNAYFQKQQYQDAFDAYKRALKDNPADLEAKINLELTLRRLEERQQQQQQPPGQNPGQDSQPPDAQNPNQAQPPNNNPPSPPGQPSDDGQRGPAQPDPSAELRRALRDAGQDVNIEDALRILDALRLKEQQLQDRFNRQPPGRAAAPRPDKDW